MKFCYNVWRKKEKGRYKKMKSLETLGAVAHTHLYVSELIARNSKTFCVPKNRRNLDYDHDLLMVII